MGKGSRPTEAKTLTLVPGTAEAAGGGPPPGGPEASQPGPADPPPTVVAVGEVAAEPEGGIAAPAEDVDQMARGEPRGYPTHLDAGVVTDPTTPDELLSTLNHLALNDAIDEERFQELYLHHFGPLGATAGAAHDHWEALMARREAERQAARQLAEQMQAAISDVRPWDPHSDALLARAEVDQVRVAFNSAVHQAQQQATKEHRAVAPHLKDRIARELGQRTGLGYKRADEFVAAWAATSNDHDRESIAMQVATAEKFGLEPPKYVSGMAKQFDTEPEFATTRQQARQFVDAMYEQTQDWLKSRGVKELVLFRGMRDSIGADTAPVDTAAGPVPASVHLNPLNSWTAKYDTSWNFSDTSGYVLTARVPATKVIGCCFTGLGCLHEQEFVVAGGQGQQVMAVANSKVRYDHLSGTTWQS